MTLPSLPNMTIQPTDNKVLFQLVETYKSDIVLPDTATIQPHGEVVAVGPDVKGISVGDRVLFNPNALICAIDHGSETLHFLNEGTIIGKYILDKYTS